jgi:hypothetical protein
MSIKSVLTTAIFAGLALSGAALAEQTWAPPDEIAPKQPAAEAAPSPAAPAEAKKPAASAAEPKKDKEKDCKTKADAKGLHGKARQQFRADCVKS